MIFIYVNPFQSFLLVNKKKKKTGRGLGILSDSEKKQRNNRRDLSLFKIQKSIGVFLIIAKNKAS